MSRYLCIEKCYHNNTYYTPGMELLAGQQPNSHFAIDGIRPKDTGAPVLTAGDDNRSTLQIIADILEKYGETVDPATPRKEVYAIWVSKESSQKVADEPIVEQVASDVDLTPFSELTADQLSALKQTEIVEKVKALYGETLAYVGVSNADLIERALEIEANQGA